MLDVSESVAKDLETLGLESAQDVAGAEAVQAVDVSAGLDACDRPVYWFTYLLDDSRIHESIGRVYIRLIQRLQDELTSRGDEHFARIRLLNQADWKKFRNA